MISVKGKTILKWVCGIIAVLLIILAVGAWPMFGTMITAANTIEKLEDNLWRVSGTVDLETLSEAIDMALPLDEEYDTLGGLVFSTFSCIPEDGSTPEVTVAGLKVKVEEICDHRIEKALVSKLESAQGKNAEAEEADAKAAAPD